MLPPSPLNGENTAAFWRGSDRTAKSLFPEQRSESFLAESSS